MSNPRKGTVYVGKKCQRGVVGSKDPIIENTRNVNVTSGSMNKVKGLQVKELSPMNIGPVIEREIFGTGNLEAINFENYWQYGKIFAELRHLDENDEVTGEWKKFRSYGYAKVKGDRHPKGTRSNVVKYVSNGKNFWKYHTAISSQYMGVRCDYIYSRKAIYAPVYGALIQKTQVFKELMCLVESGENVQILDIDVLLGSHFITVDFLKERINDPSTPFGHGYVVAGLLAGIPPSMYCQS